MLALTLLDTVPTSWRTKLWGEHGIGTEDLAAVSSVHVTTQRQGWVPFVQPS